jgi:hypothetical protein
MKQYKQKEVAKIEGVDPRSVSRWTGEDLSVKGWTKHGEGNGCYYTREQDADVGDVVSERSTLEMRKLKSDIDANESKKQKQKRLHFYEWSDLCLEAHDKAIIELRNELINSKFDNENIEKWNKAIEKCTMTFHKECSSLYQSVDM